MISGWVAQWTGRSVDRVLSRQVFADHALSLLVSATGTPAVESVASTSSFITPLGSTGPEAGRLRSPGFPVRQCLRIAVLT